MKVGRGSKIRPSAKELSESAHRRGGPGSGLDPRGDTLERTEVGRKWSDRQI